MTNRLENKIAIVTGGSAGIGAATATRMAEEGATVVVFGRREEPLKALVAKIVGDHGGVIDCESRPGRTRFRILLPVASATFQRPIEKDLAT